MKRFAKILAVVAAVCAVCATLVLAGCGGGKGTGGAEPGTYNLYELQSPTEPVTHESIEMMAMLGLTASMELNADGTGSFVLFGAPIDITWDAKSITLDGASVPYDYEDGTITLTSGDSKMIFVKA